VKACLPACFEILAIFFVLQEGKRKFDKETTKYSQSLDRYLNMKQNKSNETQLLEVLFVCLLLIFIFSGQL